MERRTLALQLVEAFGDRHMTRARTLAAELILSLLPADYPEQQDAAIEQFLQQHHLSTSEEDAVISIVEDYRLLQQLFADYVDNVDVGPAEVTEDDDATGSAISITEVLQMDDHQPIPRRVWTRQERQLMPAPKLKDLIKTFSTKGDGAQGIGLETAMIAGSVALADLMTTPYHDVKAYKQAVYAKNFLVPICSIIGLDALESALNDEVDMIAGRNIGDSMDGTKLSNEIDALMDETDRIVSLNFGRKNSDDPKRFDFAHQNMTGILNQLAGEVELKSAISLDAPHSMFFQVGTIITPDGDKLRVRARGKGRGSYARKLIKRLYERRVIDMGSEESRQDVHPIDLYGATVIAKDNEQLARVYADAVARVMGATVANPEKETATETEPAAITPYPAPSRESAVFIVKGPSAFQEKILQRLREKVPKIDMKLFDFRDYDSGFTDAKITGFYKTGEYRVAFVPFEIQFSTVEARRTARIGGKAAHFIFKLRKIYGDEIILREILDDKTTQSDDDSPEAIADSPQGITVADAVADIHRRKQDYFNNRNDAKKEEEGILTEQGRQRVEAFHRRRLSARRAQAVLASTALRKEV